MQGVYSFNIGHRSETEPIGSETHNGGEVEYEVEAVERGVQISIKVSRNFAVEGAFAYHLRQYQSTAYHLSIQTTLTRKYT
jgi:hypothetical protein